MINSCICPIISQEDYLKLESFDQESIKTKKFSHGYYRLQDMATEPYYIFHDIVDYIKSFKVEEEYEYLFLINKHVIDEEADIYKYNIKFANINFPHLSTTQGELNIDSEYYENDIKKFHYVFDMIEMFLSKCGGGNNVKILVISSLDKQEINEKLHFKKFDLMPIMDVKKMLLRLSVIEEPTIKVRNYVLPLVLISMILFVVNMMYKNYRKEVEDINSNQTKEYRLQLRDVTKVNNGILKKIKNFKAYSSKDIYYDDL
jgi:hypothetical protein